MIVASCLTFRTAQLGSRPDIAGRTSDIARDARWTRRERLPSADEAYRRGNEAVRGHVVAAPLDALLIWFGTRYLLSLIIHGRD
jgi:hypothetical protein